MLPKKVSSFPPLEVIFQVKTFEQSLAHIIGDLRWLRSTFVVKGNSLAGGINNDAAIGTLRQVLLQFLAQGFIQFPIHII